MNRKSLILIFIISLALITSGISILKYVKKVNTPKNIQGQDSLIFKRSEGWGPCPDGLTCTLDTYLYESGKLNFIGDVNKEVQLNEKELETIISAIRKSGIFEKNCAGPRISDYIVEYEINLDGKIKHIDIGDTGCGDYLNEIDELINSYYDVKRQGGA